MSALLTLPSRKSPFPEDIGMEIPYTEVLENPIILASHLLIQIGDDIQTVEPLIGGDCLFAKLVEGHPDATDVNYSNIVVYESNGQTATLSDFVNGILQLLQDPRAHDGKEVIILTQNAFEIIYRAFYSQRDEIIGSLVDSMVLFEDYDFLLNKREITNADFTLALFAYLLSGEATAPHLTNSYKLTPRLIRCFKEHFESEKALEYVA